MNVFYRFTRRFLLCSRTRTGVTLVGIVLSMALFTAVIEGAYSGLQFLIRSETEQAGAYHGLYYDLSEQDARRAEAAAGVIGTASFRQVGWAKAGSNNESKPYLLIQAVDSNITDYVAVNLLQGRLPQNDCEILLPEHLSTNGGVRYKLGETLTLSVGHRMSGGTELPANDPYTAEQTEELTDTAEHTYTVVGIYKRFDYTVEEYSCPGYTALTVGCASGSYTVFFKVKQPSKFYNYMEKNAISENWKAHSELLRYHASLRNGNLSKLLYGFAGVLVFLIAFGSISLIYNSFSISISERTRQFGILKSVGATKKQICSSVLYEAMLLSGIGIPVGLLVGCAGIGITLWCLRDSFAGLLDRDCRTQMCLVLNPAALLVAVVVCLITTLISAWIPARRAIGMSAIDAIRQSEDLKIRSRDVRTSHLTQKLFGFEGMMASKNFKRNRKRYRATVISLFLSVTLFISASSFCAYLTDAVGGVTSSDNDADVTYYTTEEEHVDPDRLLSLLCEAEGVRDGVYTECNYVYFCVEESRLSTSYQSLPEPENTGKKGCLIRLAFLDDNAFRAVCRDNKLDDRDYFRRETPVGVIYNHGTTLADDGNGSTKWYMYSLLKTVPYSGYLLDIRDYEGYEQMGSSTENGQTVYYYYPQEYMQEYWNSDQTEQLNVTKAMKVSAEEAEIRTSVSVNAEITSLPFAFSTDRVTVIYPYSAKEAVLGKPCQIRGFYQTEYLFRSNSHVKTLDSMKTILSDNGQDVSNLYDLAASKDSQRTLVTVVNVFSYGFIILISLIAVANVFNTISTNVSLRRREFAMLKSIGLSDKGFRRMMNLECVIYGVKGLMYGLPSSVLLTYLIFRVTRSAYDMGFYIPWHSVAIAVGSVFAVVFSTMLYATRKIRSDNPIDALKSENL